MCKIHEYAFHDKFDEIMLFLFSSHSVIQEYWEEAIMFAMPKIQTKNGIATMTVVVR